MRDIIGRIRAARMPQALLLLAAAMLLLLAASEVVTQKDQTQLEARAAQVLSGMAGAGQVRVVISMREVEKQGTFGSAQETTSVPCGAVAVAQGADDPLVRMQLEQALCALLGLAPSCVSVVTGG